MLHGLPPITHYDYYFSGRERNVVEVWTRIQKKS